MADTPVSRNIVRADGHVSGDDRAALFGHGSRTVWFTGLSGSGKSTLAFAVERALVDKGVACYVLDGDNVRFGLNRDLGFSPEDRTENIRRIGEVCRLFQDAGLVVLTAFISPYRADRDQVRALHAEGSFVEVFVDTPLEECERRDVKGLYARARKGEIAHMTGISSPYEAPEDPEIRLETVGREVDDVVAELLVRLRDLLRKHGVAEGTELPDHLTHVLPLLGRAPEGLASALAPGPVAQAVEKMHAGLESAASPWTGVLEATRALLRMHGAIPTVEETVR